jgi:hypothetical protein
MSEDRWRTRLRWVVVHPHDPAVLLARRDGALGELLGADALLLDCLDDHQDPAARVQRATLLAVWFKANPTSPLFVNEGAPMEVVEEVAQSTVWWLRQVLAGRPGVTNGTGGRCRTAQPGRRPPPQTAGRCTAERVGGDGAGRDRDRAAGADRLSRAGL